MLRTLHSLIVIMLLWQPPGPWMELAASRTNLIPGISGDAYAFDGDDDDDDDDDDGSGGVIGDDDDDLGDDDDDEIDPVTLDTDLAPEGAPESGDDLEADFLDDDFAIDGAFDDAFDGDNDDDGVEDDLDATQSTDEEDAAAPNAPAIEAPDSAIEVDAAAGPDTTTEVADPGVAAVEFGADDDFDFEPEEIVGVNLSSEERARARALGFAVLDTHALPQQALELVRLEIPEDEDVASALALLRTNVPDGYFGRNHRYALAMDDPCSGIRCYGLGLIGWPGGDRTVCGEGVSLGIVDTAIEVTHPALPSDRLEVYRIATDGKPLTEHGTAVATLLIGQAAGGVAGLLPQARLYAVDAFQADAQGHAQATTVDLVRALDWLLAQRVDVINLSLAGPDSDLLATAISRVLAAGIAVFAAAGNNGPAAPPPYPASDPGVIAVTAVDRFLTPYAGANRGDFIDLAAPGVRIWTGAVDGGRFVDGTSFASVYAAAAGALVHRATAGRHARDTLATLTQRARDLGAPGHDEVFGHGLLQSSAECAR